MSVIEGYRLVGTGRAVYEDDQPVEGPAVWLDSPAAVIDFVSGGRTAESIVIARGGTTTFLTPALTAGVKGVVTLQGAPESHLGILSREYGIPCLMTVAFEKGVKTSRGETVPADGTIVRMDVSSSPRGRVLMEEGARCSDELPAGGQAAAAGPSEEEMAQIQVLLENYKGETPHGSEGDRRFREGLSTDVLFLDDASVQGELDRAQTNDMLAYMGFNFWDCLSMRATEGESGLIPRQEYEAFGCVQIWQRYPEMMRVITDAVGVDGLRDIGATTRHEVGSKANLLHMWAAGFAVAFGRGIAMGLGKVQAHEREADLRDALQFTRRLYRGLWDASDASPQAMFTSMRGYAAPILDDEWVTRFRDEFTSISDPETRKRYQHFSANTELMGFLLHLDNRCGLHDTGPYPTGDGGFMIVRDHFLSDDLYHWADVASELPHVITQAMFFQPDEPLDVAVQDIGTIFTKPANYLKHLTGMAIYARDRWDTPASDIRLLGDEEIDRIQATCQSASSKLYARVATMSKRDKIMAGGQVYYADFLAPFARAAGVWDRLKDELDFFEIDPLASEAYYDLVKGGAAMELVPRLFITGQGYPPVEDPGAGADPEHLPALHRLALRGTASELPGAQELEAAGLVTSTKAGYMLTEDGHAAHQRLLAAEREGLDREPLEAAYERFLAANGPLKSVSSRWQTADEDARFELLGEVADIVERVEPALRRTAKVLPRFEPYMGRLRHAVQTAEDGDLDYVVSPRVESVHTVWMELHEDYLQTQGISREEEGSY
jgi:hypothetical protein